MPTPVLIVMIALAIILFLVILIIAIVLPARVKVDIKYDKELKFFVRFLFFNVEIIFGQKKNRIIQKLLEMFGSLSLDDKLKLIKDAVFKLLPRIVFEDIDIEMTVGTESADETALLYGKINDDCREYSKTDPL